jgi:hypothetical protein
MAKLAALLSARSDVYLVGPGHRDGGLMNLMSFAQCVMLFQFRDLLLKTIRPSMARRVSITTSLPALWIRLPPVYPWQSLLEIASQGVTVHALMEVTFSAAVILASARSDQAKSSLLPGSGCQRIVRSQSRARG